MTKPWVIRRLAQIVRGCMEWMLPARFRRATVRLLARALRVDPLDVSFETRGILQYQNDEVSGEAHFLNYVLPRLIARENIDRPVLFDVGANVGDYSRGLLRAVPRAAVYSFEPNPRTFQKLTDGAAASGYQPFNFGFSEVASSAKMYTRSGELDHTHASLYADVLSKLHGYNDVVEVSLQLVQLDAFCEEHGIERIDLLKIDTEGHELGVLKGACRMLKEDRIRLIQFEFNEMNTISRVFYRDFFNMLTPQFNLYRMRKNGLIPVPTYSPVDEVFLFQNYVASNRSLGDLLAV